MSHPIIRLTVLMTALAGLHAGAASSAVAQQPSWPEVKCTRYRKAWDEALARRGTTGLSREFLDRHEAFLASGCTTQGSVCPRSDEELALANVMVLASMNFGTASTFPPFGCPKDR